MQSEITLWIKIYGYQKSKISLIIPLQGSFRIKVKEIAVKEDASKEDIETATKDLSDTLSQVGQAMYQGKTEESKNQGAEEPKKEGEEKSEDKKDEKKQ